MTDRIGIIAATTYSRRSARGVSRPRRYQGTIAGLCALLTVGCIATITGCANLETYDRLAPSAPRGYVEFYYPRHDARTGIDRIRIAQLQGTSTVQVGTLNWGWAIGSPNASSRDVFAFDRVRIACKPGIAKFLVYIGNGKSYVDVSVSEDLLTRVRVEVTYLEAMSTAQLRHFTVALLPESAVPLPQKE